ETEDPNRAEIRTPPLIKTSEERDPPTQHTGALAHVPTASTRELSALAISKAWHAASSDSSSPVSAATDLRRSTKRPAHARPLTSRSMSVRSVVPNPISTTPEGR